MRRRGTRRGRSSCRGRIPSRFHPPTIPASGGWLRRGEGGKVRWVERVGRKDKWIDGGGYTRKVGIDMCPKSIYFFHNHSLSFVSQFLSFSLPFRLLTWV